jgi:hypothetical protein
MMRIISGDWTLSGKPNVTILISDHQGNLAEFKPNLIDFSLLF